MTSKVEIMTGLGAYFPLQINPLNYWHIKQLGRNCLRKKNLQKLTVQGR